MKLFNALADRKKLSSGAFRSDSSSSFVCAELEDHCRSTVSLTGCLTDEEIALFVEGRKDSGKYADILSHLSSCSRCSFLAAQSFRASDGKKVRSPEGSIEKSFSLALGKKRSSGFSAASAVFFLAAAALLASLAASIWFVKVK